MKSSETKPHSRAMELLDAICQDSLDAPLSHTDGLARDGVLGDYEISAMFHELKGLLGGLEQLEAAQKTLAYIEEQAPPTPEEWHRLNEQLEALREKYEPDTDEPLPAPPTWEQLDAANQRYVDLFEQFDALRKAAPSEASSPRDPRWKMLRDAVEEAYDCMLAERVGTPEEAEDVLKERNERLAALEGLENNTVVCVYPKCTHEREDT